MTAASRWEKGWEWRCSRACRMNCGKSPPPAAAAWKRSNYRNCSSRQRWKRVEVSWHGNVPESAMPAALPAGVLPTGLASRLELALSAGKEAGRLTLKYFQQDNYAVERKADESPVTIADRSAEELLRSRIAAAFPA